MELTPESFQYDLKTFGFIFEAMAIRDLKAYAQALGGRISYYRDRYGLEADVVLHLDNGHYALMEVKLGSAEIVKGASHLLELTSLIDKHNQEDKTTFIPLPDFCMVITGGVYANTLPSGVHVVPLACLKP